MARVGISDGERWDRGAGEMTVPRGEGQTCLLTTYWSGSTFITEMIQQTGPAPWEFECWGTPLTLGKASWYEQTCMAEQTHCAVGPCIKCIQYR